MKFDGIKFRLTNYFGIGHSGICKAALQYNFMQFVMVLRVPKVVNSYEKIGISPNFLIFQELQQFLIFLVS